MKIKQKEELKNILNLLNKGIEELQKKDLFICYKGEWATEKENKYLNCNNEQLTPFNKFVGSDLNCLIIARDNLIRLNKELLK